MQELLRQSSSTGFSECVTRAALTRCVPKSARARACMILRTITANNQGGIGIERRVNAAPVTTSENPSMKMRAVPAVTTCALLDRIDEAHDDRRVPDLLPSHTAGARFPQESDRGSQLPAWTLDADAQPGYDTSPLQSRLHTRYETWSRLSAAAALRCRGVDKLWNGENHSLGLPSDFARARYRLAGLATSSSPRRATAGPPTVQEIRATAGPSSAIRAIERSAQISS